MRSFNLQVTQEQEHLTKGTLHDVGQRCQSSLCSMCRSTLLNIDVSTKQLHRQIHVTQAYTCCKSLLICKISQHIPRHLYNTQCLLATNAIGHSSPTIQYMKGARSDSTRFDCAEVYWALGLGNLWKEKPWTLSFHWLQGALPQNVREAGSMTIPGRTIKVIDLQKANGS